MSARILQFPVRQTPRRPPQANLQETLQRLLKEPVRDRAPHVRSFLNEIGCKGIGCNPDAELPAILEELIDRKGLNYVRQCFSDFQALLQTPAPGRLSLEMVWDAREPWREILRQGSAAGQMEWEDSDSYFERKPKHIVTATFELCGMGSEYSELSFSGPEIPLQHVMVRRIINKNKLQWRFHCSRCNKLRFDELVFFVGGSSREILCQKCPEFHDNANRWRYRGESYRLHTIKDLK